MVSAARVGGGRSSLCLPVYFFAAFLPTAAFFTAFLAAFLPLAFLGFATFAGFAVAAGFAAAFAFAFAAAFAFAILLVWWG